GSAFAPSPSASLRSAPSALGVRLGDPQPRVAELLGPCEAALGDVCIFWTRGLELELAAGQVQRMVAHSAGDASALVEGAKGRFSLFKGPIGQAQIGMTEDFLLNVLGGPTQ